MSCRNEIKYLINFQDHICLRGLLSKVFMQDPHQKGAGYPVRSLYLDTAFNRSYNDTVDGIERRDKIRLRTYGDQDHSVRLELKRTLNNQISKEGQWITRTEADKVACGDYESLLIYKSPALNRIYSILKRDPFRPVVLIDYIRDAFCFDINNIRVTFDAELRKSETSFDIFDRDSVTTPVIMSRHIILEIKYDGFIPEWIKKLLQIPRFERSMISKYCLSRTM